MRARKFYTLGVRAAEKAKAGSDAKATPPNDTTQQSTKQSLSKSEVDSFALKPSRSILLNQYPGERQLDLGSFTRRLDMTAVQKETDAWNRFQAGRAKEQPPEDLPRESRGQAAPDVLPMKRYELSDELVKLGQYFDGILKKENGEQMLRRNKSKASSIASLASEKMSMSRPLRSWTEDEQNRIYIASPSVQGRFFGCCLADVVTPSMVTFLTASNNQLVQLHENNYTMEMAADESDPRLFSGFKMEVLPGLQDDGQNRYFLPATKFHRRLLVRSPPSICTCDDDFTQPENLYVNVESNLPIELLSENLLGSELQQSRMPPLHLVDPKWRELGFIRSLILPVKPAYVIDTLRGLKERIRSDSTLVFLQYGLGVMEQVNEEIFPDPKTRPNYVIGLDNHKLKQADQNSARIGFTPGHREEFIETLLDETLHFQPQDYVHVKDRGDLMLARVPRELETEDVRKRSEDEVSDLLSWLRKAPVLKAHIEDHRVTVYSRSMNTAMSSILQPLCALWECYFPGVLETKVRRHIVEVMLREASYVFREFLPSLTYERLQESLSKMIRENPLGNPLMTEDVIAGRPTIIGALNGWIVERARKRGILVPYHEAVILLVEKKSCADTIEVQKRRFERTIERATQRARLEDADKNTDNQWQQAERETQQKEIEKQWENQAKKEERRRAKKAEKRTVKDARKPSYVKPADPIQWGAPPQPANLTGNPRLMPEASIRSENVDTQPPIQHLKSGVERDSVDGTSNNNAENETQQLNTSVEGAQVHRRRNNKKGIKTDKNREKGAGVRNADSDGKFFVS